MASKYNELKMLSSSSQKISLSIAKKILMGFEHHYQNIKSASIEAKRCFEEKEWEKIENDSKLRLNFYDEQVDVFCKNLSSELKKQTLYGAKAEFNETQKMERGSIRPLKKYLGYSSLQK